jgi:hypothetical protein
MIKFIQENKQEQPTFGQVVIDQFFVNNKGYLCQKTSGSSFATIANNDGEPFSDYYSSNIAHSQTILKILPRITKIEF